MKFFDLYHQRLKIYIATPYFIYLKFNVSDSCFIENDVTIDVCFNSSNMLTMWIQGRVLSFITIRIVNKLFCTLLEENGPMIQEIHNATQDVLLINEYFLFFTSNLVLHHTIKPKMGYGLTFSSIRE